MPLTIEQARQIIAEYWKANGEEQFAREVISGAWDHRGDVQAALAGDWAPQGYKV